MSQKGYPQPASEQDEVLILLIIGAIIMFSVILWLRFGVQISQVFVFLRNFLNYPIWLIYVWLKTHTNGDYVFLSSLISSTTELCRPRSIINVWDCALNPKLITFKQVSNASYFYNFTLGAISIFLAFKAFIRMNETHPIAKFKKKFTLKEFIAEQVVNEPHLKLYSQLDLTKADINSGWLMGMQTTREFALENKLFGRPKGRSITYIKKGVTQSKIDHNDHVPTIKKEPLINILKEQLGDIWVGLDQITDIEVILLAMYLPRACSADPKMSDEEFKQIARNCKSFEDELWDIASKDILNSDQFDFYGNTLDWFNRNLDQFPIETYKTKYIKPYLDHDVSKKIFSKHAYTRTIIIATVFQARRLGVMAPCQIRWIQFYNRTMWALVQSIGRPSFYSENMACISHYQAESVYGGKIYAPQFDVAISGFEYMIQSYAYDKAFIDALAKEYDDTIYTEDDFI